jgi:hypothetical protein
MIPIHAGRTYIIESSKKIALPSTPAASIYSSALYSVAARPSWPGALCSRPCGRARQ